MQQRLAQMSARLEPVLTTVQSLQNPVVNVPNSGFFQQYLPADFPNNRPGFAGMQGVTYMGGPGQSGFVAEVEGLGHAPQGGQLSLALEEVRRLAEERDRLMELSNALRADLKKRTATNLPANPANPTAPEANPQPTAPVAKAPTEQRGVPFPALRPPILHTSAPKEAPGKPGEGVRSAAVSRSRAAPFGGAPFVVAGVQAPRATVVEIIHKVRSPGDWYTPVLAFSTTSWAFLNPQTPSIWKLVILVLSTTSPFTVRRFTIRLRSRFLSRI